MSSLHTHPENTSLPADEAMCLAIKAATRELDRVNTAALTAAVIRNLGAAGWVVVPKVATQEMLNAAIDAHGHKLGCIAPLGFRMSPQQMFEASFAAMLAAAPKLVQS